jgi:hypothetical protein
MPQTAQQAAESVFDLFPLPLAQSTLDEYGIDAAPEQVPALTRELLSLNLFWAHHALSTVLSETEGERVFGELCRYIRAAWQTRFGLAGQAGSDYFEEAAERRARYEQIVQEGAARFRSSRKRRPWPSRRGRLGRKTARSSSRSSST